MLGESDPSEPYIVARRVLLDALQALRAHLDTITLVGAQAIYLHLGENDAFGVSLYTTDADLTFDPNALASEPKLIEAMQSAGFELVKKHGVIGIWKSSTENTTVDLLVPERLGGKGKRAARLGDHGDKTARNVAGLEGALVDRSKKLVRALEPDDHRTFRVTVAGPMALVVAKLYKIWERRDEARNEDAKDTFDLYRILRNFPRRSLAWHLAVLRRTPASETELAQALTYLEELFRDEAAYGPQMVAHTVGSLARRDEIVTSSVILAHELLDIAHRSKQPSPKRASE